MSAIELAFAAGYENSGNLTTVGADGRASEAAAGLPLYI